LTDVVPRGTVLDMTGLHLKLQRVAADVSQTELAKVMEISNSYVSAIEAKRLVSTRLVERYLAALATCTTPTTSVPLEEVPA
jgi:predicted transcriptional regulator